MEGELQDFDDFFKIKLGRLLIPFKEQKRTATLLEKPVCIKPVWSKADGSLSQIKSVYAWFWSQLTKNWLSPYFKLTWNLPKPGMAKYILKTDFMLLHTDLALLQPDCSL